MHERSIRSFHTICPPQCIQLVESHSEHLADWAPASSQLRWPAGLEKPLAAGESVPLNGRNPSSSCFADGNLLKRIWDHDWVVKSNGLNTGTCGRLGVTVVVPGGGIVRGSGRLGRGRAPECEKGDRETSGVDSHGRTLPVLRSSAGIDWFVWRTSWADRRRFERLDLFLALRAT